MYIWSFRFYWVYLCLITNVCRTAAGASVAERLFYLTQKECGVTKESPLERIHILRIPKASSTALSVFARRSVGCFPSGPCCKYPGDPPGSCPDPALFACQKERRVIGCTNHYPMHGTLNDASIVTISIMREPIARSISAFFYPGSHHNSNCTLDVDKCFWDYVRNPRWNNVVVKMLTGQYAYSTLPTCRLKSQCDHSFELATENLKNVVVMGVAEMWGLSLMVMHCKVRHISPSIEEFRLKEKISNTSASRVNTRADYAAFYKHATSRYRQELLKQNELDLELYALVLSNFQKELRALQLWKHTLVQENWNRTMLA